MNYFILAIYFLFLRNCLSINLFEVNKEILEKYIESNDISDLSIQDVSHCNSLILKVTKWIHILTNNPLFFENPLTNFQAVTTLAIDIPRVCHVRHPRNAPRNVDVLNSIKMICDMISSYHLEMEQVFKYMPDIAASDCFVFCTIALDYVDKEVVNENTFNLAERFFEKGKSLMKKSSLKEVNQRNKKLMKKSAEKLKDAENKIKFKNLCTNSKITFPMNKKGICKIIKTNLRLVKVEVLNENPPVELYKDFLSPKELKKSR